MFVPDSGPQKPALGFSADELAMIDRARRNFDGSWAMTRHDFIVRTVNRHAKDAVT